MILGTAGYMSPEQARGQKADKRADVWAFGVVLWEMVTGRRLFDGATVTDSLAAILTKEPDLTQVPEKIRRLLRACLQKDPKNRLQAIGDARLLIEDAPVTGADESKRHVFWIPWAAAAILAGLAVLAWMRAAQPAATNTTPELAFSIVPPAGTELGAIGGLSIDRISPDGSAVLFGAGTGLGRFHIRRLKSTDTEALPSFDAAGDPFWAPDSKSIAFPTKRGLIKIHLPNGAPELITRDIFGAERGGTWSEKGTILFASLDNSPGGGGLYAVAATGGKPSRVEVQNVGEGAYFNPEFLPGGEDFLFAFAQPNAETAQIYIATLRDRKAVNAKLLFDNDTAAAFTPAGGGRIFFVRNDNLYAQKLDVTARKVLGDPELVQQHVTSHAGPRNGYFSVSRNGTIVWRTGTAVLSQPVVLDRKGDRIAVAGGPVPDPNVSLSPDEAHLLASGQAGVWIMEADGPGQVRVGVPAGFRTFWANDGARLVAQRGPKLILLPVNGMGEERQLAEIPAGSAVRGLSRDGRKLIYSTDQNLFLLLLDGRRISERLAQQEVQNAAFSPDGTWIVYHPFTESGVYVQPLSGAGFRKQIASSGNRAVWRADGKEILYYDQRRIWSVRVEGSGDQLRFTPPEALFAVAAPMGLAGGSRPLAVNHDGSRIYFLQSVEQPESNVIQVRTGAIH